MSWHYSHERLFSFRFEGSCHSCLHSSFIFAYELNNTKVILCVSSNNASYVMAFNTSVSEALVVSKSMKKEYNSLVLGIYLWGRLEGGFKRHTTSAAKLDFSRSAFATAA